MHILKLIKTYGETHLIVDGKNPLISQGAVQEEALLYQIDETSLESILSEVSTVLNQQVLPTTQIHTLSGGQQILLAVYLSLQSPARQILFMDVFSSLDTQRREVIRKRFSQEPEGRVTLGEELWV